MDVAVEIYEPESGRALEMRTTQPGMLFHSGNALKGNDIGKSGVIYKKYAGFIFEPQHYCDSPNQINFPNTILRPGQEFVETSVWKFFIK